MPELVSGKDESMFFLDQVCSTLQRAGLGHHGPIKWTCQEKLKSYQEEARAIQLIPRY